MEYRPFGLLDMTPGLPAGGVSGRTPTGADDIGRLLYSMTGAGGAQDAAGLLGGPSVRENLKAGNNFDAGLQMLAALPVVGMLGTAGKAAKGAVKAAEEAAPAAEKYITAYHGSPHSFDRFDMSKIGTGEGAQAYGHGLYFADSEDVAKSYRDRLLANKGEPQGLRVGKTPIEDYYSKIENKAAKLPNNLSQAEYDKLQAIEALMQHGDVAGARKAFDAGQVSPAAVAWFESEIAPKFSRNGSMYQVRINADPDSFLDWDKPLSEQPEHIRALVDKMKEKSFLARRALEAKDATGQTIWEKSRNAFVTGAGVGNDAAASSILREAGIPGIKYLDGGSRAAGDGSRNYVVFDDSMIEILKKYGLLGAIGVPAAMGAAGSNQSQQPGL